MRSLHAILVLLVTAIGAVAAEEIDFAAENAQYSFPEGSPLRAKLHALDSAHAALTLRQEHVDTILAVIDSLATAGPVYDAVPTLERWRGRAGNGGDSAIDVVLARARPLYDSSRALAALTLRRNAARVDSIRGTVVAILFGPQHIYGVLRPDSSSRIVQCERAFKVGDTIAACITRFGRRVYLSRDPAVGWAMAEGAPPPVGPDSIFDVYREVERPRIYALVESASVRFAAQRRVQEPDVYSAYAALRDRLRMESDALDARIAGLERQIAVAEQRLWLTNMTREGERRADAGDALGAIDALTRAAAVDSTFEATRDALDRIRHTLDTATRAAAFGADGLKNMMPIPAGSITLATGERFRPDVFLFDRAPVTMRMFDLFEHATGYTARARWRDELPADERAVHGLTAEDRVAFAHWANKRPASPQEMEYVAAANMNGTNGYGVVWDAQGFYCVRDLATVPLDKRESLRDEATALGRRRNGQ